MYKKISVSQEQPNLSQSNELLTFLPFEVMLSTRISHLLWPILSSRPVSGIIFVPTPGSVAPKVVLPLRYREQDALLPVFCVIWKRAALDHTTALWRFSSHPDPDEAAISVAGLRNAWGIDWSVRLD